MTGTRRRFSCLERVIGGLRTLPIALHVNALMTKGCGTGRRLIRASTARIQYENGGRLRADRYLIASQLFWMSVATSCADLPPTKSIMPVQKAPAPILPGIRSEPSKRKVEALARISPCFFSASLA